MSEDPPSVLRASVFTHFGLQVLLFGFVMLALGLLLGTKLVAEPAYAEWARGTVIALSEPPQYLQRAATINKLAATVAALSLGGLLFLDWQLE